MRNGLGTYVKPCHKITIQYCNWGGSSRGIRELLTKGSINNFALNNSGIFIEVLKKSGHPVLKFNYNNDAEQVVDIKNKSFSEINTLLNDYSQRTGKDLKKFNHKVVSENESVRGIWSPLHEHKGYRFKI